MQKQLIFIDDSGDPGFRGSTSDFLIMAAAVFTSSEDATKLNKAISDFRKSLGWRDEAEFKFRKTNKQVIKQFLGVVGHYDFEVFAVYINKTNYARTLPLLDREKLYNWTVKELLKIIPLHNACVKIDGCTDKKYELRMASYIRREINIKERKIVDFKLMDSNKDSLIQLADIVAGAINRSMHPEKTDAMNYISLLQDKVTCIKQLNLK